MRSLHLIASLGPGGAERQLSLIAPALARCGVEVHVAYCSGGPNLARLEASGVHLHALASTGNYDPALAWNIFQLVRRLRPDVVQTWLLQMDILGGVAALLNRVPLIISERSSRELYIPGWKTRLRLLVGRRAASIVANSNGGIDYWRPHVRDDRLHLVRNCVVVPTLDDSAVAEATAPFPQLTGRPLVLFAGRFSFEKNIPILIEALVLVARSLPQVAIAMLGEGPERASTMHKVAVTGLGERFFIPGFCGDLPAWMKRAAVCVSVSHFEGHPNVALEAAASGCPLVLSDIPAHREIFDEKAAILVQTDSPQSIAKAILSTLHNPGPTIDRAERARAIVSQWSLPPVVAAYKSLYLQVAERHSPVST
ncbi:MAG: glycosyltransferase [Burkholderiaceae bacterium]|nr:glycosyltransferase [Burkholderiaceae bacterium]